MRSKTIILAGTALCLFAFPPLAMSGSNGEALYQANCSACHGADAEGVPQLGKSLVESEFVAKRNDEQLLQYVKEGRPVDDPRNTTGIPMPPKAGNPALTDGQIEAIVEYLRHLQNGDS